MDNIPILKFYADDHDRLDHLMQEYQRLKPVNLQEATARFSEFKAGLERHIRWEEEILFPLFEEKTGMRNAGPTAVMRYEHQQIKQRLASIASHLSAGKAGTEAEESELREILGAHNWKEENVLYPAIDGQVSPEERRGIYSQMNAIGPAPAESPER